MKKYWLIFGASVLIGLLLAAGSFMLGRILRTPAHLYGAEIDPPVPAVGFAFPSTMGSDLDLYSWRGKVVLLYFGYTRCTLECPIILQTLADARSALGAQADQVGVILITLDPEYDSLEVMQKYLDHFGQGFYGAAGSAQEIMDLALSNDLNFAFTNDGEIAHTPLVFLIDRAGFKRAVYPAGLSAEQIHSDLQKILAEPYQPTQP